MRAVNRRAAESGSDQGSAALSYAQLIELTDLSRGMVAKGVTLLRKTDIVAVETTPGRTTRYRLAGYGVGDKFGRVPKSPLYRGPGAQALKALYDLSLRNEADVNAMKLYLYLCGTQNNESRIAIVSYQTIWEKTGIPKAKIRRALSVLYEHGLVSGSAIDRQETGEPPAMGYKVLGL